MGKIKVPKNHLLADSTNEFCISAYMQDIMCYIGQQKVFEDASENILKLLMIEVNAKQIERVCHYYGEQIEQEQIKAIESGASEENPDKQNVYVMVDGSLIFTREQGWMEMKLGRIFQKESCIQISKDRGMIDHSRYVSHLGYHQEFSQKMEYYLDNIEQKIFIADGAKWIWNWVRSTYPHAVQVLDFYHAKEHLCDFAELQFPDEAERQQWRDAQAVLLLNDQVEQVIINLKNIQVKKKKIKKELKQLIQYYQSHQHRMLYKTFREKNILIGSGPIESAHRHVIQQRLKLSGQRWTIQGAQQVANLRTMHKSNKWQTVLNLIRNAA